MFLCIVIIIMHSCKYFMPHLIFDWLFWFINEWIVLLVWIVCDQLNIIITDPTAASSFQAHSYSLTHHTSVRADSGFRSPRQYCQSIWLAWRRFNSQLYAQRRVCNHKIMDVFYDGVVSVCNQFWVIPWRLRVGWQ